MKYLIVYLLFSFFLFSCSSPEKPESILFKVHFQPKHTYELSTIRGSETVITYSGQEIAMRKLKSMHVKNPTISNIRTKADTELDFSENEVELTYKKTMSLDGKNQVPEGTVVRGELDGMNQPVFKTIVSSDLSIDQRIKLLQTIQNTFDQFRFPEKQMKTGDTISVIQPLKMVMEGSEIATVVTTTCKLVFFDQKMAQFDLTQTCQMTPTLMDNSFSGSGKGVGKMSYDIVNQIISEYSVKTDLTINKKLDYFEFDLKTKSEFQQSTKLLTK